MHRLKKFAILAAYSWLPRFLRTRLGGSRLLKPIRDRILRPHGRSEVVTGQVSFDRFTFDFSAQPHDFLRARNRGIERRICRIADSVLTTGGTAIDVGISYGYLTTLFAFMVGEGGEVWGFEPIAERFEVACRNLAANGLSGRMHQIALGDGSDGTYRLDDFRIDRVDLLKVDTDGRDLSVLLGAEQTLRRCHPVVIVEILEDQLEIWRLLRSMGYTDFSSVTGEKVAPGRWPHDLVAQMSFRCFPIPG